ncbi:MAG: hypothetical protein ACK56I_31320, partial [bacterium]
VKEETKTIEKDPIVEQAKRETRFKPPTRSYEMIKEEKNEISAQEERRIKAEFDKAQLEADKKREAYEKMLQAKKSALKPIKTTKEDSSSEDQRARQKKFDSSSSEIPTKRRNMKPKCYTLRLKSVERENIREERPVLTERGGNTEGTNTLPEDEGERTEETSSRTEVQER